MLTSAQGQWWQSEKCAVSRVSVQESEELEKLEGPYCHLQIPLSIPKLCGTGLGACNKVGSPQCLPRQASKSYRLFVKLLSQCAIENPLDSIMRYAGLLCSIFQYVSRSPHYYCSVSVYITHLLFVSEVINTEQILSVNFSVVLFKLVILYKRFSPLVRHVSFTTWWFKFIFFNFTLCWTVGKV